LFIAYLQEHKSEIIVGARENKSMPEGFTMDIEK
jgi:hypothetical protein